MGDVATGIALLEANVRHSPRSAAAHFGIGRAYRAAGREANAQREFRAALAIDLHDARAAAALVSP